MSQKQCKLSGSSKSQLNQNYLKIEEEEEEEENAECLWPHEPSKFSGFVVVNGLMPKIAELNYIFTQGKDNQVIL